MAEQDTLPPEVEDTASPEANAEEIVNQATENPNIEVDAGEDPEDEQVDSSEDVPKAGDWYDNLGADYKNDPDVTKYKTLEEYVKGNREVRKMIGKDKLVVPTKNSTPEEVNEFYTKLGRPEEASKYELPEVELPAGIQMPDTDIEAYRQKAFESGLTDKQFQDLYAMQVEMDSVRYNQEMEKIANTTKETETALRQEYGAAYEQKIDSAQKVINTFFKGQEMHPAFNMLSSDKGFVRAMASIAESIGEDKIAGQTRSTLTPQEAQTEMDAIIGDNHDLSKAYFDDLNPEHSAAVERVLTLQKLASAGGA